MNAGKYCCDSDPTYTFKLGNVARYHYCVSHFQEKNVSNLLESSDIVNKFLKNCTCITCGNCENILPIIIRESRFVENEQTFFDEVSKSVKTISRTVLEHTTTEINIKVCKGKEEKFSEALMEYLVENQKKKLVSFTKTELHNREKMINDILEIMFPGDDFVTVMKRKMFSMMV